MVVAGLCFDEERIDLIFVQSVPPRCVDAPPDHRKPITIANAKDDLDLWIFWGAHRDSLLVQLSKVNM